MTSGACQVLADAEVRVELVAARAHDGALDDDAASLERHDDRVSYPYGAVGAEVAANQQSLEIDGLQAFAVTPYIRVLQVGPDGHAAGSLDERPHRVTLDILQTLDRGRGISRIGARRPRQAT